MTPEALLSRYPTPIREMAVRIRRVVMRAVPELSEKALPGWQAVGFRHPEAGHIAALFPYEDHLKLYFEYGAFLDDPAGLLQGDTRKTRHVLFQRPRDLRSRTLAILMRQAVNRTR